MPPGRLFFLLAAKERTKENCRCFDAVRGCARGATVEHSETGERTMIAPAGQSTARAGLRSKLAALVVRRQAGPATKGLHAPWIPKEEVAEGAGYANAVLLFALNARALCSVSKFGSSPEPPQREGKAPLSKGAGRVSGLGDSDGLCLTARHIRRRPGIPPPRLRSAPPFDKGGFPRGLRPRKRLPTAWGAGRAREA